MGLPRCLVFCWWFINFGLPHGMLFGGLSCVGLPRGICIWWFIYGLLGLFGSFRGFSIGCYIGCALGFASGASASC